MEPINLLYCGSDDDYDELLLSLLSVMRHTERALRVHLLSAYIDRYDGAPIQRSKVQYLTALLRSRNDGSSLYFEDMSEQCFLAFKGVSLEDRPTDIGIVLLLLADRAKLPEKILYLDVKTVASGDIGEIFDENLGGCAFSGAKSGIAEKGKFFVCLDEGVLLFNMEASKKERIFERARVLYYMGNENCFGRIFKAKGLTKKYLPGWYSEQSRLKRDTILRHYRQGLVFFPYPHFVNYRSYERHRLPRAERERFEKEIDRFYLCRDAYLEYEKNEG